MQVMVIGGGGREHAVIKKIKDNPKIETLYALPGNAGMEEDAHCVPVAATDIEGIVAFAKEKKIGYAVVTPDDPLIMGLVDRLENIGVACFGPRKDAALIEGSKSFAKDLMKKYGIPTARYEVFTNQAKALAYLETQTMPIVIKADGPALGKGVIVAKTMEEARQAVISMMEDKKFGKSGLKVVIEEFLEGPEVSILSFTDGNVLMPMVSSMDHKRSLDGDQGLNTGGMGTIAPNPYYTGEVEQICREEIFLPTMMAMNREGRRFAGCLYFGLMITADGPKVIEYNCRFGDPETQVVLPLLESDLFDIFLHVTDGTLEDADVRFSNDAACCVIKASKGYPVKYEKGFPLTLPEDRENVFIAGAKRAEDGTLVTDGGRVVGVTARAKTLAEAIEGAYRAIESVHFDNEFYRRDIGQRALRAGEEQDGLSHLR